jgi:hypothetical protein
VGCRDNWSRWLEPCDGKLSRTVPRGRGHRKVPSHPAAYAKEGHGHPLLRLRAEERKKGIAIRRNPDRGKSCPNTPGQKEDKVYNPHRISGILKINEREVKGDGD